MARPRLPSSATEKQLKKTCKLSQGLGLGPLLFLPPLPYQKYEDNVNQYDTLISYSIQAPRCFCQKLLLAASKGHLDSLSYKPGDNLRSLGDNLRSLRHNATNYTRHNRVLHSYCPDNHLPMKRLHARRALLGKMWRATVEMWASQGTSSHVWARSALIFRKRLTHYPCLCQNSTKPLVDDEKIQAKVTRAARTRHLVSQSSPPVFHQPSLPVTQGTFRPTSHNLNPPPTKRI